MALPGQVSAMAADLLLVPGVKSDGYGIIAKVPMRDKRLSAEAKAIYAYLCSYTGAGTCAYPSLDTITEELGLSRNRYYKHLKFLTAYGYVRVHRRYKTSADDQRASNVYEIVDVPEVDVDEMLKLSRKLAPSQAIAQDAIVENPENPSSGDVIQIEEHHSGRERAISQNPRSSDVRHFEDIQIEVIQNEAPINNNVNNYQSIDPASSDPLAGLADPDGPIHGDSSAEAEPWSQDPSFCALAARSLKAPTKASMAKAWEAWVRLTGDEGLDPEEILGAYERYRVRYKASNPNSTRYAKQLHDWLVKQDGLAFDLIGEEAAEAPAEGEADLTPEELRAIRSAKSWELEEALASVDEDFARLLRSARHGTTDEERVNACSRATVYIGKRKHRKAAVRALMARRAHEPVRA